MTKNNNIKIAVIGAGAWGCGIAGVMAENGHQIALFTNEDKVTRAINNQRISPFLPNITLSKQIVAYTALVETVQNAQFIFMVVPSKVLCQVLNNAKQAITKEAILTICSKGIDDTGNQLFSQICEDILPDNHYTILSGPNFAGEVAAKLPTVTTIAAKNKNALYKVINLLENNYFKPQPSSDVITTQIAGTIKNILAIGCGIIDGLKLGKNAQAALLIKGINEINLLAGKLGGRAESLISPAGFGDIFLTCSSTKSRNNSLGLAIGQGGRPKEILNSTTTYEGAGSAKSIIAFAKKHNVELPLCQTLYNILYQDIPTKDIKDIIYKAVL